MNLIPNPNLCPPTMVKSFTNYRDLGVPCGSFGNACLENDLLAAFLYADSDNLQAMPHIVAWLYHNMPASIWKSSEAINAHISKMKSEHEPERDEPIVYERGELAPTDTRTEHDRTL